MDEEQLLTNTFLNIQKDYREDREGVEEDTRAKKLPSRPGKSLGSRIHVRWKDEVRSTGRDTKLQEFLIKDMHAKISESIPDDIGTYNPKVFPFRVDEESLSSQTGDQSSCQLGSYSPKKKESSSNVSVMSFKSESRSNSPKRFSPKRNKNQSTIVITRFVKKPLRQQS